MAWEDGVRVPVASFVVEAGLVCDDFTASVDISNNSIPSGWSTRVSDQISDTRMDRTPA